MRKFSDWEHFLAHLMSEMMYRALTGVHGQECKACRNFPVCTAMFSTKPDSPRCGFIPCKFFPAEKHYDLDEGTTCGDCDYHVHCRTIFKADPKSTECEFYPPGFMRSNHGNGDLDS